MISGSIARRWARALFALGEEDGNLLGLVREIQRAAEAWKTSSELRNVMTNPFFDESARQSVWDALIMRMGMSRVGKNCLGLLREKGRVGELPSIARELQVLSDKRDNRLRAEVISCQHIAEDTLAKLRSSLQRSTGKSVVVTHREDISLLGGVVTKIGNVMYDGSLRSQLLRMRENMMGRH